MILADKKRENNIAEYIIHMYQTEDLVRAYELDIERIDKSLISLLAGNESDKEELKGWYQSIIDAMKNEKVEQTGHIEQVKKVTEELLTLYKQLTIDDDTFLKIGKNAQPLFDKSPKLNEIEVCLNGMYAYLILRADDIPVPELTKKSVEIYSEVLSYLSFKYKQKHYMSKN